MPRFLLGAQRGGPVGYAVAIALVALAAVLNGLLWEMIRPQAGPLFLLAVLMSAFHGGLGPGVVAALLATFGRAVFYQEPLLDPLVEPRDLLLAPIFLLSALLVSWLTAARSHRAAPQPSAPFDLEPSAERTMTVPPAHMLAPEPSASAPSAAAALLQGLGGARAAAFTFAPPLALLAFAVVLRFTVGVPIGALTRDRAHFVPGPFYAGAYSTLGLLLWASTAFVCFFAAARSATQLSGGRRSKAMFRIAGLLSILLLADDMLMLHEIVFPKHFGIHEHVVVASLGVAGLFFTIRFRREILSRLPALFFVTVICFAASLVSDAMPVVWGQYLIEDGFKLLGIVGWLSFWTQRAAMDLLHRQRSESQ